MPNEKFWDAATAVEGDNSQPALIVAWHHGCACGEKVVSLNGVPFDPSAIDRLIRTLRKARRQVYGK